jgi:hypothetical protein
MIADVVAAAQGLSAQFVMTRPNKPQITLSEPKLLLILIFLMSILHWPDDQIP